VWIVHRQRDNAKIHGALLDPFQELGLHGLISCTSTPDTGAGRWPEPGQEIGGDGGEGSQATASACSPAIRYLNAGISTCARIRSTWVRNTCPALVKSYEATRTIKSVTLHSSSRALICWLTADW